MKRKINSYVVFTSFLYRIAMFGIVPAVLLAIYVFCVKVMGISFIPYLPIFMIMIEIIADNWMFGGIQGKDAEKMDFLKTSNCGMRVIEDALGLDLLRRLLSLVCNLAVCLLAGVVLGDELLKAEPAKLAQMLSCMILISYDISVLGTLIARFQSAVWINMVIAYVGFFAGILLCFLADMGVVFGLILAVFGVLISFLTVKAAMRKVRGGFYDK